MTGVRIDKWLWAARCYKTRAKAKEAIDGGKVEVNGDRTKPSKEIKIGDTVRYRAGYDERTLIVRALSDVRRGAPEAATLFDETEASQQAREDAAARRKAEGGSVRPLGRPTKRDRRQIHRFKSMRHPGDD